MIGLGDDNELNMKNVQWANSANKKAKSQNEKKKYH
jgi:hypothetical protein